MCDFFRDLSVPAYKQINKTKKTPYSIKRIQTKLIPADTFLNVSKHMYGRNQHIIFTLNNYIVRW